MYFAILTESRSRRRKASCILNLLNQRYNYSRHSEALKCAGAPVRFGV